MNHCECCQYLIYPEYESSYSTCKIFGEKTPDEYATEDGCNCSSELLQQILDRNEEALEKEHEAYVEWFLKQENDKK